MASGPRSGEGVFMVFGKRRERMKKPIGRDTKIELDEEEIEALIMFQEDMINQARDSCEHDEVLDRKVRLNFLKQFRAIK